MAEVQSPETNHRNGKQMEQSQNSILQVQETPFFNGCVVSRNFFFISLTKHEPQGFLTISGGKIVQIQHRFREGKPFN